MNNTYPMVRTSRIVAGVLTLLIGRFRGLALALGFVTALVGATTAQAQCPASWVPGIGTPGTYGNVNALAVLPGGDVIVGAGFVYADGVSVTTGISRYNPSTGVWSALGSGINNGDVYALAVLPGGDVIVGGSFTIAGGVAANYIARYNPSSGVWSALGPGTNIDVYALAVLPGGDVIVGGAFTTAGGVSANRIARYNPSTDVWSALGTGTNERVLALAVLPGGDVIVGGLFTSAGSVAGRNFIARCNPNTGNWSALGTGTNGTVRALAVLPGGHVIVGGMFPTAGGVPVNNIARYNPSPGVWSALGAGINGIVNALAVLPGGDVVVGGGFTTAGGVAGRNNIVRYNPSTGLWSVLGSGVGRNDGNPPFVLALAVLPGVEVIAAGDFFTAGGVEANNIARCLLVSPPPNILLQPVAVATTPSGTAGFSVVGSNAGANVVLNYQWLKNGAFISTITNPSAATPVLFLSGVQAGDLGSYSCVVSNTCGSATTNPAVLSFVNPSCGPSDIAGPGQSPGSDGQLTADDIILFLNRFFAGC
jgi:uncharacterized protein (DUF849 family)